VRNRYVKIQFLIQLIATYPFQVVMALIEQLLFQELAGIIQGGGITWAHALEEFD
jgi:hypothetical protein